MCASGIVSAETGIGVIISGGNVDIERYCAPLAGRVPTRRVTEGLEIAGAVIPNRRG
jgi:hypothetical protein